jgi:hypothetical protein
MLLQEDCVTKVPKLYVGRICMNILTNQSLFATLDGISVWGVGMGRKNLINKNICLEIRQRALDADR